MKKTLATLLLATIAGTTSAQDVLVHKSEHYNFYASEVGVPEPLSSGLARRMTFNNPDDLTSFYVYAENFTGNSSYDPGVIIAEPAAGFLGITGRLHQQYIDTTPIGGGVHKTPTEDDNYFSDREFDSHWMVGHDEGWLGNTFYLGDCFENIGGEESLVTAPWEPGNSFNDYARASFGDNMSAFYIQYDQLQSPTMPVAYVVTDDPSSIGLNFFIGGISGGGAPLGAAPLGGGPIASTLSDGYIGDPVSFNLQPVPEPTTLGLLALGATGVLASRRRRGKA
jgi:hypothetical protein